MRVMIIPLVLATAASAAIAQRKPPTVDTTGAAVAAQRSLELTTRSWTGDFDGMLERRAIRVFVPASRTLYHTDKGRERGITAELVRDFERWLNQKYKKQLGNRPITVFIVPTTRDKLLPRVMDGRADIAAGDITVTEARSQLVDFVTSTDAPPVRELIVTGPGAPALKTLDDLSGQRVYVRPSTSYHESLVALNQRLQARQLAPIQIVPLPDALEDEDKLEMVNAGLVPISVVDDWIGRLWAAPLPRITLHTDLIVRDSGVIGWAVRKNSPQLVATLDEFYGTFAKKQALIAARFAQQARRIRNLRNNGGGAEWKRFQSVLALFEKYGKRYRFDPLMLAAQGFQESQLRQEAVSHVGAIGIMQVMPATGADLRVGDIYVAENNVHAGAKYMDQLMTLYFKDANFSDVDRTLFAFASYNTGAGNIARMRKLAVGRGLNPDVWFNNVELVVADKIGIETTTYVRNIYKYYASYRLQIAAAEEREKAKAAVPKP
jgi:membrane-bound lytic murein transglycosylase MltF